MYQQFIIFVSLLSSISMSSMHKVAENIEQYTTKIDQLMDAYQSRELFSGTILVAKQGTVIFKKAYGFASQEFDVPNTLNTKFKICSMTKQFTAAAIMILQEHGKLHITDPLNNYISDYPRGNEITIHHLLTHSSGIFNYFKKLGKELNPLIPITLEKLIESFKHMPLAFNPGTQYDYSNSNYVLLTYIIENVSGKSYDKFLHEYIFVPLQMNNTRYDDPQVIINNRAQGYSIDQQSELVNAIYLHPSVGSGAGALISTIEDMFKWHNGLFNYTLLTKKSVEQMTASFMHCKNEHEDYHYGYGLCRSTLFDRAIIFHGGCADGFVGRTIYFPEDQISIIMLSNHIFAPLHFLEKALAALMFGLSYKIPVLASDIVIDPKTISAYTGYYRTDDNKDILIFKNNDQLCARFDDDRQSALYTTEEGKFVISRSIGEISFHIDKKSCDNVKGLTLHTPLYDMHAKKI